MSQNKETTIAANVQELVQRLNQELKRSKEAGLRGRLIFVDPDTEAGVPQISVRIWKEIELLNIPPIPYRATVKWD